jgi:PAS domain S-box-containing protein
MPDGAQRRNATRGATFGLETGARPDYAGGSMRLRTHLVLLVLAAVIPVLAFAGTMVFLFAKEQRHIVETGLQETTRALAVAVDRELASAISALQAVAMSHTLDASDLAGFRAHAVRILQRHEGWTAISLFDARGRLVLSTTSPPPGAPTSIADHQHFQTVLTTGQPVISSYFPSLLHGGASFAVAVPVKTARGLSHVLVAGVKPSVVSSILRQQRVASGSVWCVIDDHGIVLARTKSEDQFVGRPAPPEFTVRTRERGEGVVRATTLEGSGVYSAFSRIPVSGWTVAVGVPLAHVDGSVRRSVMTVIAGGTLLLAFGIALTLAFGRRIARPLATLSSAATTIARGEPFPTVVDGVAELDELARTLQQASEARRASEAALRASEQRLRRVVESNVTGVVFSDRHGRIADVNDTFLALTGFAREDVVAGRLTWSAISPPEHAASDARAAEEARTVGWWRPYEKELLRRDGSRVPVMVAGALLEPGGDVVVTFVHDLTEIRWANSERERLFVLLDALLSSAPVGYAVLDRDLRFVVVNDVLAEVNGRPAAHHIGQTVAEVVPHLADVLEPLHQRVLDTGEPLLNLELPAVDASEWWHGRHYLRSYYPVRSRTGEVLGVGAVVVDITERKRAEQRLAAQHAVTQILAEADGLDDAAPRLLGALCHALDSDAGEIWRIDPEAGVLRCVDAIDGRGLHGFVEGALDFTIERGVGLPGRVWASGKPVWIADVARERDEMRARAAGLHAAVAFPIVHGDIRGVAAFYSRRVREADSDLLEMLGSVGSQIGQFVERRRAERERARLLEVTEQALRGAEASERRHRLLVEALPHLAWTRRSDGTSDYVNRQWFEYTGLTPQQSEGDGWMSAVHPDDVERVGARWRQALAQGEGYEIEIRLRRRDGFYRWFLTRVEPIRDGGGAVVMWLGIAVDIDTQKRAELVAVHANRAKDNFLATLSHELRTPLTAMLGWVRLLRTRRLEPSMIERGFDTIERNVKLQAQIVDDLLDVSRIVAGKLDLRVVPVDLGQLIEEAVDGVRPSAEAKALTLEVVIDDAARRSAGDPDRLMQVLGNLLTNAVKFTDRGGRVEVRLERRGGRGRIAVRDTGKGIDPALLPHVFDRFRQGMEPGAEGHGGLGLGLAIVKHLVELHGGTVFAESEGEGRGATFVVQLALADEWGEP